VRDKEELYVFAIDKYKQLLDDILATVTEFAKGNSIIKLLEAKF
jgi:hypothetical protein